MMFIITLTFLAQPVASMEVFKANSNITIQKSCVNNGTDCSASGLCTIRVINPEGLKIAKNQTMTYDVDSFNYTISETDTGVIGVYDYKISCFDSGYQNTNTFEFEVTYTGRVDPPGSVLVIFIIAFVLLFGFLFLVIARNFMTLNISSMGQLNFDLVDLLISIGSYFGFLAFVLMQEYFLNHPFITGTSQVILDVGLYTHIIFPGILFVISFFVGAMGRPRELGGEF